MSEPVLQDPHLPAAAARPAGRGRPRTERFGAAGRVVAACPWWFAAAGLVIVSALLVRAAGTRPGYDPYGWLVWGKLTIHGKLDTNGAPSWKPLPFLFTVPYAVFGRGALWLWMTTAVAVSLSGAIFAWRIAWRLVAPPPDRRWAGYAAGAFAVAGVFGIVDYSHYVLSAQSDSMIVALCLGAIDCWLCGRRRWALALWVLGSLGRPEVWPFLLVFAVWGWRRDPALRRWLVPGLLLVPLLWFGIPALSAKTPFVASDNALHSPRELHSAKLTGTLQRFVDQQTWPLELLALLGVALAGWRRRAASDRMTLALGAGVVVWVVVEVAFALHGFPAVPRYLFEAVAVTGVLAGVSVGRLALEAAAVLTRALPRLSAAAAGRLAGAGVLALAVALVPVARARYAAEHRDLRHEQARTREIGRLAVVVSRLTPARILGCGQPNVPIGYQSAFAWDMGINTGHLYVDPKHLASHPRTVVDFFPLSNGWHVLVAYANARTAPHCGGLRLRYRS